MSWEDKIAGCFGAEDKRFALHYSDSTRAAAMLSAANAEDIGFQEFCDKIEHWLANQGCSTEHVAREMDRVKDIKSYFNYD